MSFSAGPPMPSSVPMPSSRSGAFGVRNNGFGAPSGAFGVPAGAGTQDTLQEGPENQQMFAPPTNPQMPEFVPPTMPQQGPDASANPQNMLMMLMAMMSQPQVGMTDQDLRSWSTLDQGVWGRRDTRMLRHRRLYELLKPPANRLKPGQRASVTTDAKAIVHKFAGMFAKHAPAIRCIAGDDSGRIAAERAADFLRSFRRKETRAYGRGPHGGRAFDEAVYLCRDGWIVELITLDPSNPQHPFKTLLLDPMTVYPTWSGEDLIRVLVKYRTTLSEARDLALQYGAADVLARYSTNRHDSVPIEIVKVFSLNAQTKQWEIGVMIQNQVITKQVIGYCPVLITMANSRIYAATSVGEMATTDRYENVGVGVFDVIEEAIKNKNEDYSIMREMMKRDANPPRVIFTDDEGKLDELKFEPGQNVHLWADDKFQLVQLTPDFRKIQALLQLDQQGINHGSFPDAIWGEGQFASSAQEYFALGNARDQIYVYGDALERHYEAKYVRLLEIYRDYGSQMQPATFTSTQPATGIKLAGQAFSLQDIDQLGPEPDVEVRFSDVTPQNESARGQLASTLVQDKILDLHTAREIGVPAPWSDQPELIGQRVLQDVSLMHPLMTQLTAMTAALYSPDPVMQQLAQMLLPGLIQQAQQTASGQQPGPGQSNSTPGQKGVPARGKNMPAQGNAPEAGSNAGMPEGQSQNPQQASQPGQPS